MKIIKIIRKIMPVLIILILTVVFYYPVIFGHKYPIPSDALVGIYHPWRDFFADEFPRGLPFKNFLITDPVRQMIPWRKLAMDQIRSLGRPGWNPYSFSGTPLSANFQTAAYYPLNIMFLFRDFIQSWTSLIISQQILALFFMYLYLKNRSFSLAESIFGSIVWAFSGFMIVWLEWGTIIHTALWLPLILLSVDKFVQAESKKRFFWGLLFALSIWMTLTAGHIQIAFYTLIFSVVYTFNRLFRLKVENKLRRIIGLIFGFLLPVALFSYFSRNFFGFFQNASRSADINAWTMPGWFMPWQNLVQFIAPDFFGNPATGNYWGVWNYAEFCIYIGILPLMLGLSQLISTNFRRLLNWKYTFLGTLLFILPNPISYLPFEFHIPVLSVMQPTRLIVIAVFSMIVLSVYGLRDLSDGKIKTEKLLIPGIILIILWSVVKSAGLWRPDSVSPDNLSVAARNLILPTVLYFTALSLIYILKKQGSKRKVILPVIITLITVIDLFRFGWKFTPFSEGKYFFPETRTLAFLENQTGPFRIATTDDRILPPETGVFYKLEMVSGYDPVYSERYAEFIAAMERGGPDINPPYGFNRIIQPKNYNSPLFRLLNVRYLLTLDEITNPGFTIVLEEGLTRIYEYHNILPRIYLVSDYEVISNNQKIIAALYDPDFDAGNEVILETDPGISKLPLETEEKAEITEYGNNSISVRTDTKHSRILSVSNIYNDGWRIKIDGNETKLLRANYVFSAAVVPVGLHEVKLVYLD